MKGPDTGYPHVRAERPSGGPARPGSSPHPPQPRRCAGTAPLDFKGGNFVKQANYYAVTEQGRVEPQAIPPSTTPEQIGKPSNYVKSQTNKEKCTSWSVQPGSPSVEHFNSSAAPTKPSKTPKSHKSSFNLLPYPPHSAASSPLNCSSFQGVLSCCRVPLLLRVCVAMIALLLLLAGDVERNPGPTLVTVDKVDELAALIAEEDWYLLLGQVGVSKGKRDQLREENAGRPRAAQKCFIEGLHLWVTSDENPTYEKIVAVFNGDFLTNKPLARKVEEFAQTIKADSTGGNRPECSLASHTPAVHLKPSSASITVGTRESAYEVGVAEPTPSKARSRGVKQFLQRLAKPFKRQHGKHPAAEPQVKQVPTPAASVNTHTVQNIKAPSPSTYLLEPSPHESKLHSLTLEPKVAVTPRGSTTLTIHNLASLLAILSVIAFYWRSIGLELGFDPRVLDTVNIQVLGVPLEALTELLTMWLQRLDPPPTLEALANVIGGPVIKNTALANSLRQIQLSASRHQQSLPRASATDDVVAGYAGQMRGYYRTTIPQCFSLTWPPPPTRKVFNLSMISHKQYNYGRGNDELVRLLHFGNVEDFITKKSSVELEDLFHLNRAKRKVVLIEGAPGAGKSTLAWHICQKWEAGELFQEFKLVVFVQLRDPAIQSAKSLADLFPSQWKSQAREVVSRLGTKGGEGLLFVLDGWDEFSPGLYGSDLINNLISHPSAVDMASSTLLITSRPIASGDLHQYASSRVETVGFKRTEMDLYFKEALQNDSDSIRELNACLEGRPVIKASCYLPLNTVIVVHLFLSLGNCLPRTLHGVFLQLVIHCIVRHIMKQQTDDSQPPHISSLDNLPPDMQTQLSHICAMAYQGVIKNKVTFSEEDLKLFNLPTNISTLSLIQVVVSFMPYRLRSYNFLHLSVQELLTAYHISKLPPEEQVKIFKQLFGQPRFAAVFQYYAAFTKLQTPGIRDIIVSITRQRNKDLLLTLMHCLYEAQDSTLCQFVASQLNGRLDLSSNSLSPVDCIAVGYFLHQCATIFPMSAKLSKCSLDSYKFELLGKELKRPTQAAEFEVCIDLSSGDVNGNLTRFIASKLIASASEDVSSTIISKLDLSCNPIQDGEDGLSHLCQALTTNTSLVELNLSNCELKITEENGQALSHMLKTNKTLKSLEISPIVNTKGRGIRYLSEGISSSSAISKLSLSYNPIQDGEDGLSHLCHALTTNTSLVELNLSDCKLHAACGPALRHMLETNKTLTSLDLSNNRMFSDHNVTGIADGLRSNHNLKCLNFSRCGARMKSLADSLMVNDSLEELDLNTNTISPEAARGLSDMLKHDSTLKKLDMSQCQLPHKAVKLLASALEVNSTLEELDLSGNPGLTDTALVALGESLKRNTGLKRFDLCSSYTTANGWRQFVQCLKHNHSLELLITNEDKLDVEHVNTVRREKNLPELQWQSWLY